MRQTEERDRQNGGDGEYFGDVGTAYHR
jgi:hypothetical protein